MGRELGCTMAPHSSSLCSLALHRARLGGSHSFQRPYCFQRWHTGKSQVRDNLGAFDSLNLDQDLSLPWPHLAPRPTRGLRFGF